MSEITHQEARALLQRVADQPLEANQKAALEAHLATCPTCNAYADSLASLEANLKNILHRRWDRQQAHLDRDRILNSQTSLFGSDFSNLARGAGKVALAAAFLLGFFMIANLVGERSPGPDSKTQAPPPTPGHLTLSDTTSLTPSVPLTLTEFSAQVCENVNYIAQADDTLEKVASMFGTTRAILMEYNHLDTGEIIPGMELLIPMCKATPSRIPMTPHQTITTTPLLSETLLSMQPE